jgi:TRAP-type C4-dicarboxylate transport system permease small subunit
MEKVLRWSDRIASLGGALSGAGICLGVLLVTAEIVMRTFFSRTLYITEEYTGYLMTGLTFLALGYTLREKGHIRMTFLHTTLHGKKRLLLEAICLLTGLVFTLLMTWTTALFFWDSVVYGSRSMQISETYLAIPQFFLPLGSGIFALQFGAELLRTLAGLFGDAEEDLPEEAATLGR